MIAHQGPPDRRGPAGAAAAAPTLAAQADLHVEHRVGPAQLLLSQLLMLPAAALEERVAAELEANPALERNPDRRCTRCGRPMWSRCVLCEDGVGRTPESRPRSGLPDRAAARADSRAALLADAARGLSPAERAVAARLLDEVDDLGLLPDPVDVVAARLRVAPQLLQRVVATLRAAGAPGVCAMTLDERIRLQVAAVADVPPEVDALLQAGPSGLLVGPPGRACGLDHGQVRAALSWIRSHVAAELFGTDPGVPPALVDLVVRRAGDGLVVDAVPGSWSALRIAGSYLAAAGDSFADEGVARARRFLDGLSRRTGTMLRVAEVAVTRQSRRVVGGPRLHVPLRRRAVAAELGLHESTVSRAVAGKHLLLPSGETVAFAALFGGAHGVQHCLHELVAAETTALSDAELARALAARGHRIARRTVAKYRAVLGIPPQHRR
jgi:RNA polymerase sigma-54 factor